jgi:hypothetical protein
MQERILFFIAAAILAIMLILVAFVMTVDTSVNAAYASDEPAPTLAVPPTYTISPTPD